MAAKPAKKQTGKVVKKATTPKAKPKTPAKAKTPPPPKRKAAPVARRKTTASAKAKASVKSQAKGKLGARQSPTPKRATLFGKTVTRAGRPRTDPKRKAAVKPVFGPPKYEPAKIEPKWQKRWEKDQLYRAVIDPAKPKFYALTMLPYPSGN